MNRIVLILICSGLTILLSSHALAQTWNSSDVGAVGVAGSDSYNGTTGVYTLQGSGANIGGTADAFHFAYVTVSGDGEFTARIASIQNTNAAAQAGIMVRQSLDPGSINALAAQTVSSGVIWQQRTTAAGNTTKQTTANGGAPYWIKIVKDGDLVTSYQSPNGSSWTLMGVTQLTFTGPVDIGLAVSSHVKTKLCTATFDNITFETQPSYPPPVPWVDQDIGAIGQNGGIHFENNLWTVYACGANIGGTSDAFHYVYQPLYGDGTIVAQVDSLTNTNAAAKAGVMIRQDLSAGSANALVAVSSSQGISFQYRSSAGGSTSTAAGAKVSAPYWVKLVRSGNQFYAYQSADGASWQQFGVVTINMTGPVYVGLAETSHNNNTLAVGVFSDVQVGPAALQVNSQTDTSVDLIWPSLADPSLVAQYEIDRNGTAVGDSLDTNFEDIQLSPSTTYSYSVKALSSSNVVLATSPILSVTTDSAWLPSPWSHLDIGEVDLGGGTLFDHTTGIYAMTGSGADIAGKVDAFQFAEQPLTGDGQIIARVASISATNSGTKAGIMMRETNDAGSRHASMLVTYGNVVNFLRRTTTNGGSSNLSGGKIQLPIWLKLIRQGNLVTSYQSNDGLNWLTMGSDTVAMSASIEVGLALTSHDATAIANATVDNVTITSGIPTVTQPPSAPGTPTQVAVGDASASIKWTAATDAVGVMAYQVLRNGQVINTTAMLQYTDVGLSPAQSYVYTIKAINVGGLLSVPSSGLTVTTQANGVPSPWMHQEVGTVALAGTASGSATAFSISASGNDIGGNADAFGFVYQPLTSDGQITARVTALQNTNAWAKAGVMLRQSLDSGSPYAFVLASASQGMAFEARTVASGNSSLHKGPIAAAPVWVRVVRQGSVMTAYSSSDAVNWTLVSQQTIPMNLTIYAGLAVTSHKNGTLTTATFDQVSFSQANVDSDGNGLPDWWEILYFGHIGNDPAAFSPSGDGYTLLQEYQMGRNPIDFYQGATPNLSIVGGNNQAVVVNAFAGSPLAVQVSNSAGTLLTNGPVSFNISSGSNGGLTATSGGATSTTLTVRTNAQGVASVYFQASGSPGSVSILATAGTSPLTAQVGFTEQVNSQAPVLGALAAGGDLSFFTKPDGSLKGWGSDILGQLGLPAQPAVLTPTLVGTSSYLRVASRGNHTLFLHNDHSVWAVGQNYFGQLGIGNHTNLTTPQQISGLANITAVATGASHSLALTQGGTVLAWGGNYAGQLGLGTTTDSLTPTAIAGLSGVTAIAAGRAHSLALSGGNVYAWGDDSYGQLGNGTRTNSSAPVPVAGLSNIIAIAAGDYFSVAIAQGGTVYVWGANSAGQLALGHNNVVSTPQAIGSVSNATAAVAGAEHLIVLGNNGSVSASGANFSGQLGTGNNSASNVLQSVGLNSIIQIAAGFDHSLALKPDGSLLVFGANNAGQLGNGSTQNVDSPTPVAAP